MKDNVEFKETRQLRENVLQALREPDTRLDLLLQQWERTSNPLFVWQAIAASERELPDWVRSYLASCADRMLDATHDFRKALPEIMGFAGKRGPRPVWNDEEAADRYVFSALFFFWICVADTMEEALAQAQQALPPYDANADDLTLYRWLAKQFGLAKTPRTLEAWRKAIVDDDAHGTSLLRQLAVESNLLVRDSTKP
jgi:hypothetical protein